MMEILALAAIFYVLGFITGNANWNGKHPDYSRRWKDYSFDHLKWDHEVLKPGGTSDTRSEQ